MTSKIQAIYLIIILLFFFHSERVIAEDHNAHRSYFFITVDVESLTRDGLSLPELVFTEINGIPCGISAMMDIADKYNAEIVFFVNVYEFRKFGEQKVREIVQYITGRGHDVQLHTDQPLSDGPEKKLNQYSLSEQNEIIRKGRELLFKWTGHYPVAHRAGTYAANDDTLKALIGNQLMIDSSFFYGNINNRFTNETFNINAVTRKGPLTEIPVTVFELEEYADLFGHRFPARGRIKKLDIDSTDLDTQKKVISSLAREDIDTIVFFMHSWSFVSGWEDTKDERAADKIDINEFEKLLEFINSIPDVQIISAKEYGDMLENNDIDLSGKDFVPSFAEDVGLNTYIRRVLGIHRGNYRYWIMGLVVLASALVISAFMLLRKRNRHRVVD